jgi:hypothetical protein
MARAAEAAKRDEEGGAVAFVDGGDGVGGAVAAGAKLGHARSLPPTVVVGVCRRNQKDWVSRV